MYMVLTKVKHPRSDIGFVTKATPHGVRSVSIVHL